MHKTNSGRYRVLRWHAFPPSAIRRVLVWQEHHYRRLPWREPGVTDFALLLAEMLLRRTSARAVARVWPELSRRYPSPALLVSARRKDLVALLRPLGLVNVRVKALQDVAAALVAKHGGKVPRGLDELEALPHIGKYAAHAVAAFAFGEKVPLIDANTLRIFKRFFCLRAHTQGAHRSVQVWRAAKKAFRYVPVDVAGKFNYALLDLADAICTVRRPHCELCPLQAWCYYGRFVIVLD